MPETPKIPTEQELKELFDHTKGQLTAIILSLQLQCGRPTDRTTIAAAVASACATTIASLYGTLVLQGTQNPREHAEDLTRILVNEIRRKMHVVDEEISKLTNSTTEQELETMDDAARVAGLEVISPDAGNNKEGTS